jgi:hypothetical protein
MPARENFISTYCLKSKIQPSKEFSCCDVWYSESANLILLRWPESLELLEQDDQVYIHGYLN